MQLNKELLPLVKTLNMEQRDLHLLQLRPAISSSMISKNMGPEEQFQNKTLRPVIKLQNDLLVAAFKNYIQKHKNVFRDLTGDEKMKYVENAIQRDIKFRNSLKGMILGQFTIEEYEDYVTNSSALNKRMMNLVKERIQDKIQLLDPLPSL
jgi:hypothetical protein